MWFEIAVPGGCAVHPWHTCGCLFSRSRIHVCCDSGIMYEHVRCRRPKQGTASASGRPFAT